MSGLEILGAIAWFSIVAGAVGIAWLCNKPGFRRRNSASEAIRYDGPNRRADKDAPDVFDQPLFRLRKNKDGDKIEEDEDKTGVRIVRKE